MSNYIQREAHGKHLSILVLDRAERRNALCIELLRELSAVLESLEADGEQRVVILRGNGPVFSAGLDLREAADPSLVEASAAAVEHVFDTLAHTLLVTISAAHGGAFAGGAGLMAACDIVVAADDTRIGFPEARRGLLPALICDVMRMRVREGDLRDLFLTGDVIDADRAREMGLVQRVVPGDELLSHAIQVANSVLAGGPETIRATKRLLSSVFHDATESTAQSMSEWHLEARRSPEAVEGLQAFIEQREPNWNQGDQP